jgi:hypothetical protein
MPHHPLRIPIARAREVAAPGAPAAPQWPTYRGTSQFVGTSTDGRANVFVDPLLGAQGLQNARDLVSDAPRVAAANDRFFGITGGSVDVIVYALGGATDGSGGADHMACDFTNGSAIEVCASFGNSARVSALFEAELSECCMGGNLCGVSTGEALSRWCALVVSQNALSDFATAPAWMSGGMPDYVDRTDRSDQNSDSVGCGMAFISWLLSQRYTLATIAQAIVALGDNGTLAQMYERVTSNAATEAWNAFVNAVRALPGGVTSDDPFGGMPAA